MMMRFVRAVFLLLFTVGLTIHCSAQWSISVSVIPVTCPGGSNGSATVNVTGTAGPYSFQWNDPASQATATAVNLSAGVYEALITDTAGSDTLVFVEVPQPDEITFDPNITSAICSAATGKIKLDVNGGTPPYHYSWAGLNTSSNTADDLLAGSYHVVVTDNAGCEADTTIIVPEGDCIVRGEQAFTPNGDGINDTWAISNISFFPESRVVVYNRWGQIVHEQKGIYESWDGTHWGQPVPDATYFYVVYKDADDKDNVSTGSVTIVR